MALHGHNTESTETDYRERLLFFRGHISNKRQQAGERPPRRAEALSAVLAPDRACDISTSKKIAPPFWALLSERGRGDTPTPATATPAMPAPIYPRGKNHNKG